MDIKNDKITIKPLRDKDVGIFSKWLAKEYIYKWFCPDGEEHKMAWLDEVNNRNTQYHYMKHFIVYYNDKAIGFCLYFSCSNGDTPKDSGPEGYLFLCICLKIG